MAHSKYDWVKINWRLSNREIAAILKCPYSTVAKRRMLLKVGKAEKPAPRRDKGVQKITYMPTKEQQAAATRAAQQSPRSGRSVENCHAKQWIITAPDGTVYHCRNLYEWVRQNSHLFNPPDVIWRKNGRTIGEWCRASSGLQLAART